MYAQVAMVGGAVEAQVDAKGDGRPGGVLGAAVEADLGVSLDVKSEEAQDLPCWRACS